MTIHSNSSEDFNGAAANRVENGSAACGDDNITGGVNADQIATSHWDSNAGQNRLEEPGRSVAAASVVAPPWGKEASRLLHVGGIPEGAKRAVCGALEQWLVELVCECGERLPHSGDRIVSNTEHLADQPGQLVVRLKSPELLTLCLEKAKGRRIGGYDVRLSRVRWNGSTMEAAGPENLGEDRGHIWEEERLRHPREGAGGPSKVLVGRFGGASAAARKQEGARRARVGRRASPPEIEKCGRWDERAPSEGAGRTLDDEQRGRGGRNQSTRRLHLSKCG
jgi:hypothetical protein